MKVLMKAKNILTVAWLASAFVTGHVLAYTSASYVQEGLIAQWDGIDNAIVGGVRCHDATATVWKDLTGNLYDITGLDALGGFVDDAFAKTKSGAKAQGFGLNPSTYEVVLDFTNYSSGWLVPLSTAEKYYPSIRKNGAVMEMFYGYNTGYGFKNVAWPADNKAVLSCTKDGRVFLNGSFVENNYKDYWGANGDNVFGGSSAGHSNNGTVGYRIHAIRFYDRILTDEERARNAQIDGVRFLELTGPADLIVGGEPMEVGSPDPAYGISDGWTVGAEYDCTAPKTWTNSEATVAATCTGYVVRVDGEIVGEGAFAADEECTFHYVHPASEKGAELTWKYAIEYRVTAVADVASVTVRASKDWAKPGEEVTLTAEFDDESISVLRWTGVEGTMSGNSFTFTMPKGPVSCAVLMSQSFYVAVDGDDEQNDGRSTESPLATIGAALAKAMALGTAATVLVGPGEYLCDAKLVVDGSQPIRLQSLEGAERTFIVRNAAFAPLCQINSTESVIDGFTFTQNGTTRNDFLYVTSGTVSHCIVSNAWFVKGIQVATGGYLVDSLICNNNQEGRDAVISMIGGTLDRCRVVRNLTNNDTYGEGVEFWTGGVMRNCLVADNTNKSNHASGVYARSGSTVENCTIANNVILGATGVAGVDGTVGPFRNCIIYGNRNASGVSETVARTYDNCASTVALSGSGNIVVTGMDFADPAAGDYRVMSGSTIDAGAVQSWMAGATDLAGNPRIIGETPDMGCYEYRPGALRASVDASATTALGRGDFTLTATVSGSDLAGLTYAWTVSKGGETVATGSASQLSVSGLGIGIYDVALTVRNGAGATYVWDGGSALLTVYPKTVYVAKDSTPQAPYDSWETAANDLATVTADAMDGMEVLVGEGVYTNTVRAVVSAALKIASVGGRDKTVFTRTASGVPFLVVANDGAVVDGITFTQPKRESASGGRVFTLEKGLMRNCAVVGCYAFVDELTYATGGTISNMVWRGNYNYGRVSNFNVHSALVTDCLFVGNQTDNDSYGAAICVSDSATIRNCLIVCNTNSHNAAGITAYSGNSLVENCTIARNVTTSADVAAGVEGDSSGRAITLRNCIVKDNIAKGVETNLSSKINLTVSYTLSEPAFPKGEGNISGDPRFRNAAKGDFRLLGGSPAVDAGLDQPWMVGATDFLGKPRIALAEFGGVVDMGCYERQPNRATVLILK